LQDPPKLNQNCNFWSENSTSGNPASLSPVRHDGADGDLRAPEPDPPRVIGELAGPSTGVALDLFGRKVARRIFFLEFWTKYFEKYAGMTIR
jgi:hypothetical protein